MQTTLAAMHYTENFAQRLKRAIEKYGSQSEVARQAGVQQSLISRLLMGKTQTLEYDNARKLTAFFAREGSTDVREEPEQDLTPLRASDMKTVPLLGIAQAAGYAPAVEPLVDFLNGESDETHQWSEAREGYFALRLDGSSGLPTYPPGTVLLVAGGEFPQRGDVVVAKIAEGPDEGAVVVKRYHRANNVVTLSCLDETADGREFEWNIKENPSFVAWMFPVVRAEIDLRRQRWEQKRPQ